MHNEARRRERQLGVHGDHTCLAQSVGVDDGQIARRIANDEELVGGVQLLDMVRPVAFDCGLQSLVENEDGLVECGAEDARAVHRQAADGRVRFGRDRHRLHPAQI